MAHFSCRRPQVVAGDNLGALTGQLGCRESAKGVDAGHSCTPSDITYPLDLKLLDKARQSTERVIDDLRKQSNGYVAHLRVMTVARRLHIVSMSP